MTAATASLGWFARHEVRLAWRDMAAMLQGGRRGRRFGAVVAIVCFVVVLHLVAYAVLKDFSDRLLHPDKSLYLAITGSAVVSWTLFVSQAMETVTRSFYARADLDLILSSPAPARKLFAVRMAANAVSTMAMAAILIGPVINVAALLAGPHLLFAYGVLAAMAASAVVAAILLTLLLFLLVGPKRARLAAQIAAAVIGAGFVVWLQVAAIMSFDRLSRTLMFQSPEWVAGAPGLQSPLWWPVRVALGDGGLLLPLLAGALALLALTIALTAPALVRNAASVASVTDAGVRAGRPRAKIFRARSQAQSLRAKEWTLLWRDPWLVSQSLMQMLYLAPPALLLWRDFGSDGEGLVILAPILVMAAGQLAGGLAWLALSGEDAPDLVATAPISAAAILRAKIEAVLLAVALPILPIVGALVFAMPRVAVATAVGAGLAAAGAAAVQHIFRSQAKRANFRRRQVSSRFATFAEAFFSISMAAAAGCVAGGLYLAALVPAAVAGGVLIGARALATPPA